MKELLLIDASSLVYRCFHALPPLSASDGRPMNAIYGTASVLLRIFREEKPEYAAACLDRPEPTFRKERYADYKIQRPETPEDLASQLREVPQLFREFGIRTFETPGLEADDLIAALAVRFRKEKGLKIVILTGDLDTLQLVSDGDLVVRTFRKGITDTFTYDETAVRERYGLRPDQLLDYKALIGDPSDNIKGVPGVGPKTACAVLQNFGTLERFWREGEKKDPKLAGKLAPFREQIEMSRFLAELKTDAETGVGSLEELRANLPLASLAMYLGELGFASLVKRLLAKDEPARKDLPARSRRPRQGYEDRPPSAQGSIF